jgi:SAM-dependent methyltransferase
VNDRPRTLKLFSEQLNACLKILTKRPSDVLLSPYCRQYLARDRWEKSGRHLDVFDAKDQGIMPGTIAHNRRELEEHGFGSLMRTARLINPLSALDPVFGFAHTLKVLSIGPRTEMELLHLVGIGFRPENIYAVDLISSSPWIELGDMHALPYEDGMFDVVISSWVLNYSNDPQRAVDEMLRVCRPSALVAIGVTYTPDFGAGYVDTNPGENDIVGSMHRSADDLARLIGDRLERVLFRQEPVDDAKRGAVMLIARIAQPAAADKGDAQR